MVHAYAICSTDALGPGRRRGLGGAALNVVACDDLAAVYSRHRTLRPAPTAANVLVHERVVEAVMEHGPALPFRFATRLESPARLAGVLEERHDELRAALERVRGRVEMGVRVLPRVGLGDWASAASDAAGAAALPPAQPAPDRGRRYLLARAALRRRADQAARELHRPLAEVAVASVLSDRPRAPATLVAAYLVDKARVESFRERFAELAAALPGCEVFLSGPLPPYNFVDWQADADRG
jgi:hypothetical protein